MRGALLFMALLFCLPIQAAEQHATFVIGYVNLADDPRHAEFRGYANIVLRPAADPFAGAQTAVREGKVLGRALGIDIELQRSQVENVAAMIEAVRDGQQQGIDFFLLDAPAAAIGRVARQMRELDVLLFNVTSPVQSLRATQCQPNLLHTFPAQLMLTDALVQFAVSRHWEEVLILHGPQEQDREKVDAFRRSAKRFGLDIADVREFSTDNNPRERGSNNIVLLTHGDYDAIYVADATQAVARFVPYQSKLPRPVFGDAGLMASAWHWAAERYGAPQLNQRFEQNAERKMNSKDWSAWAAVRVLQDALRNTGTTDFEAIEKHIRSAGMNLDTYKGSPGSFRDWNGQLRQPVMLHTENAVIAYAPFEGFLHPENKLDTLGVDRPESECELK